MSPAAKRAPATVGVADHAGWAILMTVARDGVLLDRRRVELLDTGLPALPHHHEAQGLPLPEGVALIERVRASAERQTRTCLDRLAGALSHEIGGIALRACPPLPVTVEERITNYRAQCVADGVMYRQALAAAATARGWFVHWYDARRVFAEAASALGRESIEDVLARTRAAFGPPWRQDHRMAMAAAIAATSARHLRRD